MRFKQLNRENTDSIKWALAKKQCKTKSSYVFSIADSDYETAKPIKTSLMKRVEHGAFGYVYQDEAYYSLIQNWYQKRYGCLIDTNDIQYAPSVINAIAVSIMSLTKIHDGIIIQPPVYHMFKQVIQDNNRLVIENKLKKDGLNYSIDYHQLESLFKQGIRTILLCNPHNPVGRVWTKAELETLMTLVKQYHVLVIADEIHGDIIMPNHQFYSMAHFLDEYSKIMIISSPTKVFNLAGLNLAHMIIRDNNIRKKIKHAYQKLHLNSPNIFALTALKSAYKDGEEWLDAQNKHIFQNYYLLKAFFKEKKEFILYPMEGSYLAWIQLVNHIFTVDELIDKLHQYGVFFSNGIKFGPAHDFFRISLACSKEQLTKGLIQVDRCLRDIQKPLI